ncbi:ATP-binding cassette domain-containing protein [Pleurocapsales cyanobacterium LEGE 06147]|nr:ATP-binding cassette domain-containing protein [Pleurocapsales cyanobacterium LEGE 06147]
MTASFAQQTIVNLHPFVELNNQGQILRLDLKEEVHRLGRDPQWSDLDIPEIGWTVLSRRQAVLQKEGKDYRIYDGDRTHPSRNGIFINQTRINVSQGYLLKHGVQLQIGQDPRYQILLTYYNPSGTKPTMPSKRRLDLNGLREWPVELGRAPRPNYYSSIQLDAPTVSRLHATVYSDSKGGHIIHDHSTNGTFINGKRLEKRILLHRGDTIQIGPFILLYTGDALELNNATNQIRLDAHELLRKVKDKQGKEKVILDNVSLAIEPGQLVALVGGSGAGKSTLMKSLLGIAPTTSGNVYLNGDDLRLNWAIYRSQIGYVPQDDIIHLDLTVEEVLTYACKLRLPPDINVKGLTNKTLDQIKLTHVRHTLVRDLSGGQRKRVSIGVELLADPKLFFLDEPTSGLDPGLDKEMMNLLRELADQGRTVVLVTHATANIEVCDRIAFMGRGGKLCFFGPPREALPFFNKQPDFKFFPDIYLQLDKGIAEVDKWASLYLQSPQYISYIETSLSPGKDEQQSTDASVHTGISPFKQLWLLSQRYWQLVRRDTMSLVLASIAGPITIGLTALSLQHEEPLAQLDSPTITQASLALKLLFIFSCIAIWVGLSNSIREIVKEAAIYFRERLLNLGLLPYLSSKLLVRGGIAIAQTILITIAVLLGFNWPESNLIPWPIGFAITTFLTLIASTSLSLMLSAYVKNENEGNSILPLIMIPQIIFSGVLFNLDDWSSKISWFMLSRWSIGAYGSLANVNAMMPNMSPGTDTIDLAEIFEPSSVYEANWDNLALNWSILGAHTLVYLLIAFLLQKRKDIF